MSKNYIVDEKMAMVEIKMLNFYLSQAMDKDIITKKKFLSYGKYNPITTRHGANFESGFRMAFI